MKLQTPSVPVQLIGTVILACISAWLFGPLPALQYTFTQVGGLFMDALKMLVVPLAFVSITAATIRLGTLKLKRLMPCFLLLFMGMSLVAFFLGYVLISLFPITPFAAESDPVKAVSAPTVWEFIRNCIPVNPFKSLAEGNMLQVIVLSLLIALASLHLKARDTIVKGFETAQAICIRLANMVMRLAPIGVFCLLYPVLAKNFSSFILAYVQLTLLLAAGIIIYMACCSIPLLVVFKVEKPLVFFKTIIVHNVIGAIAGGSMTYLAPRIANLKEHTTLNPDIIDFFIPTTAVLTRMGSAICVALYTGAAATIFHISLSWEQVLVCAFLTIIALMCAPGIIGGTLMDCAIIWAAIGTPIEAIAYLAGIDYIIDILRTILNIQGGEIITACMNRFALPTQKEVKHMNT